MKCCQKSIHSHLIEEFLLLQSKDDPHPNESYKFMTIESVDASHLTRHIKAKIRCLSQQEKKATAANESR